LLYIKPFSLIPYQIEANIAVYGKERLLIEKFASGRRKRK